MYKEVIHEAIVTYLLIYLHVDCLNSYTENHANMYQKLVTSSTVTKKKDKIVPPSSQIHSSHLSREDVNNGQDSEARHYNLDTLRIMEKTSDN